MLLDVVQAFRKTQTKGKYRKERERKKQEE
jgi:hypothetical protein